MTYKYSKTTRKGTNGYRRTTSTAKYTRNNLDKLIEAKVQQAIKKASRGSLRSIPVQLIPAHFDRDTQVPLVQVQDQWTSFIDGPSSAHKYAILPISELITTQHSPLREVDHRLQSLGSVFIKGVALRMTLNHTVGARLLVFAFQNESTRDSAPSSGTRPFFERLTEQNPPGEGQPVPEVVFDIMSKEQLTGMGTEGCGKYGFRNIGGHDGPFAVEHNFNGDFEWRDTGLSAFTSRFGKGKGRPTGTIYAKVDGGVPKMHGRTFKEISSVGIENRTRQVELFVKLNRRERLTTSNGSLLVNERPLELFIGFDTPGFMDAASHTQDVASGAITAMDMEVYYE